MVTLLDANAILRYLIEDIEEQAEQTRQTIESGAEVTIEVLAECVYVLVGVYEQSREDAANVLIDVLGEVECERKFVAREALRIFSREKLDFVDCVLAAETAMNGRAVLTFDKKLNKLIDSL